MALSEQEKRMLAEIERALIAEDPRFAQRGESSHSGSFSLNIRSISLILLGICFLIGGIALAQSSLWFVALSVVGFLIMFGGGLLAFQRDSAPQRGMGATRKSKVGKPSGNHAQGKDGGLGDRMEDNFRRRFER